MAVYESLMRVLINISIWIGTLWGTGGERESVCERERKKNPTRATSMAHLNPDRIHWQKWTKEHDKTVVVYRSVALIDDGWRDMGYGLFIPPLEYSNHSFYVNLWKFKKKTKQKNKP